MEIMKIVTGKYENQLINIDVIVSGDERFKVYFFINVS